MSTEPLDICEQLREVADHHAGIDGNPDRRALLLAGSEEIDRLRSWAENALWTMRRLNPDAISVELLARSLDPEPRPKGSCPRCGEEVRLIEKSITEAAMQGQR